MGLTRIDIVGDASTIATTDIGYLDLEPRIDLSDFPSAVAYFRFKATSAYSLKNKISGHSDAFVQATTPNIVYGASSVTVNATAIAFGEIVVPPYTVISVVRQVADVATSRTLGGYPSTSSTSGLRTGLTSTSSELYQAAAKSDANTPVVASLAQTGGDRWEMIAGVFDSGNNLLKVRRPRTNQETTQAFTTWGSPYTSLFSLLGQPASTGNSSGPVEGALTLVFNTGLTSAQQDTIFTRAQAAMVQAIVPIDIG